MSGLLSIYDVACPFCGADVGALCVNYPSGHIRRYPHTLRARAFRAASLEKGGTT